MKIKNFSPYKLIVEGLAGLKAKEKIVIQGRFGIGEDRKTLSAIGANLKLSRERVRQIERDGLKRLSGLLIDLEQGKIGEIVSSFSKHGGVAKHDLIAQKFLDETRSDDINEFNALNLIFYLIPDLKKIEKTKELEDSWILSHLEKEEVLKIINDWASHLKKVKKPLSIDVLVKAHHNHTKYDITFLSELPSISKHLITTEDKKIGLSSWPEINPKNVRDKIYYVLKKEGRPLHFVEIANKINNQNFTKRKVVKATVHNELIADKRFVLIGRGIYALLEWGYKPGTVLDVIREVLSEKKAKHVDDIVKEVLRKRDVKRNTILINLQTKNCFSKVAGGRYKLIN